MPYYSSAMLCFAPHFTVWHCSALSCTVVHHTVVYHTALFALHCTTLHHTVLFCTALHCTAQHCTALNCTAQHCTAQTFPTKQLIEIEGGERKEDSVTKQCDGDVIPYFTLSIIHRTVYTVHSVHCTQWVHYTV